MMVVFCAFCVIVTKRMNERPSEYSIITVRTRRSERERLPRRVVYAGLGRTDKSKLPRTYAKQREREIERGEKVSLGNTI